MDVGALRTLALELNFSAHGVPATVQRPYPDVGDAIVTRGIWVTQFTDALPDGHELQRREPIRVMALRRDEVTTVPRGTTILAPEVMGGPLKGWRVDAMARVDTDHYRVVVIPDPDLDALVGVEL